MTVLCGGATSSPRPFTPAAVFIAGVALSDLLESIFPNSVWPEIATFIAGEQLNANQLCGTDPPAVPTFTAVDILQILSGTPIVFPTAFSKITDLVKIAAWYTFCRCDSVSTPGPPPAPAYPPTAPTINPNQIPTLTGQICSDLALSFSVPPRPAGTSETMLTQLLPGTPTRTVNPPAGTILPIGTLATALPGAVPQVRGILDAEWDQSRSIGMTVEIQTFDSNGNYITTDTASWDTFGSSSPAHIDLTFPIPPTTSSWLCFAGSQNTQVGATANFELIITCGNPNLPVVPCCPPDLNLQGQLQLIINMLNNITSGVAAPPAYTKGTAHTGVTGTGTLPLTDLFGVLIDITQGTPTNPQLPGNPPYEWSVGWMSIQTGDGMIQEIRITRQHQVWAPELMPLATVLGYFLNPGFVVTITELLPAP